MKLAFTINLGNYENMRIETGEYEHAWQCALEAMDALEPLKFLGSIQTFIKNYLKPLAEDR